MPRETHAFRTKWLSATSSDMRQARSISLHAKLRFEHEHGHEALSRWPRSCAVPIGSSPWLKKTALRMNVVSQKNEHVAGKCNSYNSI